ncbi:MAG: heme-binding protein [candidate division KSB1 bacterium]|nr:heme-binding protein [candidate division KSB1 bacterium]MDZ7365203.1 heme-binding protein [candidate division KSB1 bacterium]MDZ7406955.1 heme-binding protein [candidate division KSB1 bacterium]
MRFRMKAILSVMLVRLMSLGLCGCDSVKSPMTSTPTETPALTVPDVQKLMTQAVEQAQRLNETINVAIVDREGNVLGVFRMNGAPRVGAASEALFGEIAKARTAAFLSSNERAFTTLTACFITRSHFPPTADNTAAGPLFGVPFSNRSDSDIQPNGGPLPPLGPQQPPAPPQPGLTNIPGGVPIYKSGALAGGLGISGGSDTFTQLNGINNYCTGVIRDEIIALGAIIGYEVPSQLRGDNIYLDGIRLPYANATTPAGNFTLTFDSLATRGAVDPAYPIQPTPSPKMPVQGEVRYDAAHDYRIKGGSVLTASEVRQIITQAVTRANKTRAAVRLPLGRPAQVFIAVADLDGTVLGVWRTPDASTFSYDVCVQKARTVVAFSNPSDPLGANLRTILGLSANQPLAVSTRAIGFLAQRYYPPGINQGAPPSVQPPEMGPFYIYVDGQFDFQYQRLLPTRPPFQNGIQIFPGGIPLYKNGPDGRSQLAGGIGVSGDGVDQDDYIAAGGATGFEAPLAIRSDQITYRNARLPYLKFPRQPDLN